MTEAPRTVPRQNRTICRRARLVEFGAGQTVISRWALSGAIGNFGEAIPVEGWRGRDFLKGWHPAILWPGDVPQVPECHRRFTLARGLLGAVSWVKLCCMRSMFRGDVEKCGRWCFPGSGKRSLCFSLIINRIANPLAQPSSPILVSPN